ncbi:MAG: hypothetical protein PVS3B3_35140 [Ktedonobacteraceae bacterium]
MHPFCPHLRLMSMNEENNVARRDQIISHLVSVPDGNDDAVLILAAMAGDMDAFARLVERHTERIYSLAMRLLGNTDEAEDATQEAFIRAYSHLAEFRNTAAFATWLYRIALNICRDQLRHRQTREHYAEMWRINHLWNNERYSVDPEQVALALEDRQMLNGALAQLPACYRATILLHDVDGLTMSEVATLTGVPLPTAKSRLRRARMALVTLLDESARKGDSAITEMNPVPSQSRILLEQGGAN